MLSVWFCPALVLSLSGSVPEFFFTGGTFGTISPSLLDGGSELLLSDDSTPGQSAGGTNDPSLIGYDSSSISIYGRNLQASLVDPNFDDTLSVYELSGLLADGTALAGQFMYIQNGTGASFQLFEVPEPSAIVLASFAALGVFLGRPRRCEGR